MAPNGCKVMNVPKSAPISEIMLPNDGTALAIMYPIMHVPNVHPSQMNQCVGVLAERCFVGEPRRA